MTWFLQVKIPKFLRTATLTIFIFFFTSLVLFQLLLMPMVEHISGKALQLKAQPWNAPCVSWRHLWYFGWELPLPYHQISQCSVSFLCPKGRNAMAALSSLPEGFIHFWTVPIKQSIACDWAAKLPHAPSSLLICSEDPQFLSLCTSFL